MIFLRGDQDRNRERVRRIADRLGYFWLPCPLCGEPYAGFEWNSGSIPVVDANGDVSGQGICMKPGCQYEAFVRAHLPPSSFKVAEDVPIAEIVPLYL